jgi:hypothetical protein
MSSSTVRTEKGQEHDQLVSYPHRRASIGSQLRPWAGQQVGEEEQDEGREDEHDVRWRRKRWCTHDVKHPHGRAIATSRVGVGTGVGQIRGGDACSYVLYWECDGAEVEAWGGEKISRMANEVVATEARTIIIVRRYRWPNGPCLPSQPEARPI